MNQNMGNFSQHFESTLAPQQHVRSGGEKDSLEGTFKTVSIHQYENFMFNLEEPVLPRVDFLLDGDKKLYLDCHLVRRINSFDLSVTYTFVNVLIEAVCQFL